MLAWIKKLIGWPETIQEPDNYPCFDYPACHAIRLEIDAMPNNGDRSSFLSHLSSSPGQLLIPDFGLNGRLIKIKPIVLARRKSNLHLSELMNPSDCHISDMNVFATNLIGSYSCLKSKLLVIRCNPVLSQQNHKSLSEIYNQDSTKPFTIALAYSVTTDISELPVYIDVALITVEPDGRMIPAQIIDGDPLPYKIQNNHRYAVYETKEPNEVAVATKKYYLNFYYILSGSDVDVPYFRPYLEFKGAPNHVADLVELIEDIKQDISDGEYLKLMSCAGMIHSSYPHPPKYFAGTQTNPVYYSSLRVKIMGPSDFWEYDIMYFMRNKEKIYESFSDKYLTWCFNNHADSNLENQARAKAFLKGAYDDDDEDEDEYILRNLN
jgi:hypothetical protein